MFSGIFTIFINRVGDALLISILLCYVTLLGSSSPIYGRLFISSRSAFFWLLFIGFMTKRALFPFSSWLPIAIAAPTPISSLVHSSTLVTAGLYLIFRFDSLYNIFCPEALEYTLIVSLLTSLYARLNSILEVDLKKLVALSTLRHLGFIGIAYRLGCIGLAFFHLCSHALFKSLLFMRVGNSIRLLGHSQDLRSLSFLVKFDKGSSLLIIISLFNLFGVPFIRGYFSKDLVLEYFIISSYSHLFGLIILVINVLGTYLYTLRVYLFIVSRTTIVRSYQIM